MKIFIKKQLKIAIFCDNWSQSNNTKIKFFSTPHKEFRKLLASRFLLVIMDEYKTSCISSGIEGEMTKQKYDVKGKMVECHKVLK